jgi:hypothetical protein
LTPTYGDPALPSRGPASPASTLHSKPFSAALVRATRDGRHAESHLTPTAPRPRDAYADARQATLPTLASLPFARKKHRVETTPHVSWWPSRIGTLLPGQPAAWGARHGEFRPSRVARTSAATAARLRDDVRTCGAPREGSAGSP